MATPYEVGARAEYEVMQRCRADGCVVWRTAGSKGETKTDLLIGSEHTGVVALNIKRGSWAPPAERIVMQRLERYGILPVLAHVDVLKGKLRVRYQVCGRELSADSNTLPPWSRDWLAQ